MRLMKKEFFTQPTKLTCITGFSINYAGQSASWAVEGLFTKIKTILGTSGSIFNCKGTLVSPWSNVKGLTIG